LTAAAAAAATTTATATATAAATSAAAAATYTATNMLTDMTPTAGQLYGSQIPAMGMNITNIATHLQKPQVNPVSLSRTRKLKTENRNGIGIEILGFPDTYLPDGSL